MIIKSIPPLPISADKSGGIVQPLGEDDEQMLTARRHNSENSRQLFISDLLVKQVAHPCRPDGPWLAPVQRLAEAILVEVRLEAGVYVSQLGRQLRVDPEPFYRKLTGPTPRPALKVRGTPGDYVPALRLQLLAGHRMSQAVHPAHTMELHR